jgi:hypothetical protein
MIYKNLEPSRFFYAFLFGTSLKNTTFPAFGGKQSQGQKSKKLQLRLQGNYNFSIFSSPVFKGKLTRKVTINNKPWQNQIQGHTTK